MDSRSLSCSVTVFAFSPSVMAFIDIAIEHSQVRGPTAPHDDGRRLDESSATSDAARASSLHSQHSFQTAIRN